MPTVRCPSCKRALNLPEHADFSTARCPLCQTTFDVADQAPSPRPATRVSVPGISRVDTSSVDASSPFDFDDDSHHHLPRGDRKALTSAGHWLQAAGLLGLAHSL